MIHRLRFDKYSALYLWALFMIVFTHHQGQHVPQLDVVQAGGRRGGVHRRAGAGVPRAARDRHLRPRDRRQHVDGARHLGVPVEHRQDAGSRGDVHRPRRLRDRRPHQRVLRRQAEGQQLHRHARHESGHHRVRPEDVEPVDQRRVHRRATATSAARRSLGLPLYVYYLGRPGDHRLVRVRAHAGRPAHVRDRRQPRSGPPRRPAHRPPGLGSLVASAVIAGFAGIIYGWKVGNYAATVGPGYLFPAIAAVFFGASQLKGRPNVWGTFIALYALAWGIKGLQLTFTDEHPLDRATLPGRVAARRRLAGQPSAGHQGAEAQDAARRGAPGINRRTCRSSDLTDRLALSTAVAVAGWGPRADRNR